MPTIEKRLLRLRSDRKQLYLKIIKVVQQIEKLNDYLRRCKEEYSRIDREIFDLSNVYVELKEKEKEIKEAVNNLTPNEMSKVLKIIGEKI